MIRVGTRVAPPAAEAAPRPPGAARETAAPQVAPPPDASADQKIVLALEEQFRLAKVQNDVKALERLLDDAVVSTNQTGAIRRKADLLELWQTFRVDLLTLDSADVQIAGDLATVTGRQTEVSGTGDYPMLFTRIWRRAGSTWRLFSVTQFRDPSPLTEVARQIEAARQLFRFEYELYRDNALLGRPSVTVVSGRPWSIQIPGEPELTATAGAAGKDVIMVSFMPRAIGGPLGNVLLKGTEPGEASWSAGSRTYRIRIWKDATASEEAPAVRVGGGVARPEKIKDVPPVYPAEAKKAKVAGMVILELVIDEQGDVSDMKVVRSVPMLDQAAMDAVRQWKYQPATMNGKPVKVVTTVNVTFALQ
jgi:TonB family protein